MDANSKAERLAAAKKKLKKFQQKNGPRSPSNVPQDDYNKQGEPDDGSMTVNNDLSDAVDVIEEFTASHHMETNNQFQKDHENGLLQTVETHKNGGADDDHAQETILQLQSLLDEERKAHEAERSRSTSLEIALSNYQNNSKEEELKNTVTVLIEEKNDLISSYNSCEEALHKSQEESLQLSMEHSTLQAKYALLEQCRIDEVAKLEADNSRLSQELALVKDESKIESQFNADLKEEFEQLKIRHTNQTTELNQRDATIKELTSQIELLNLNMQQLKNAGPPAADQNLQQENTQNENSRFENEITDLREQLGKLSTEKDVLAQQYQQYILRLNGQVRTVNSQIEAMALEKRNIEAALEAKKERVVELEAIVADLEREKALSLPTLTNEPEVVSSALEQASADEESKTAMIAEIEDLRKKIAEANSDNDQLAKLAIEKDSRIQELEIKIDRLQSDLNVATANQNPVQNEKLLQAMQNDKVAASRAIAQNRQLKIQLEELEKAFIQLSNDKLTLTEQSQATSRYSKECTEKLQILEPELARLRSQVEDLASQKDATIYWKQELEEAHDRIQALTHQNSELKKRVIWNVSQKPVPNGKHKHKNHDHHHIHDHGENAEGGCDSASSSDGEEEDPDWIQRETYEKLRFHYEQLELQLKRTTNNVAALTDEKQKLEHLVLQLQSETETIGEYVSLYQVQRGLLRRRAEQLADERQRLKERIDKLTLLLPRLAPQLEKLPQWLQLQNPGDAPIPTTESTPAVDLLDPESAESADISADQVASNVVNVLMEIAASHIADANQQQSSDPSDPFLLNEGTRAPHENFHPCNVCSGRLMTV